MVSERAASYMRRRKSDEKVQEVGGSFMTTSMDQLIEAAMNQNFVPVVDDRGIFIGIVRRQAIIRYCYEKSRAEEAPQPGRVVPEYAAAH